MRFRERQTEVADRDQGAAPEGSQRGNLQAVRQAGEQLYQAADDAIDRALSGDSLAFLEATQQAGGE